MQKGPLSELSSKEAEKRVYERQAEVCKAFANPIRLQLLDALSEGERPCSELQIEIGISKANLSQHLAVLKSAGIVVTRRDGTRVLCALAIPEVEQACRILRKVLIRQIESDGALMR